MECSDGATSTSTDTVWYASFGSMMNMTALRLRNIHPLQSVWCEIPDWRRIFYAISGVATLEPASGEVTHAVAHQITRAELAQLQEREPPVLWVRARLHMASEILEVPVASFIAQGVALEGLSAQSLFKAGDFVKQASTGATGQLSAPVTDQDIPVVLVWQSGFDTLGEVRIDDKPVGTPSKVYQTQLRHALPTARYIDIMVEGARRVSMSDADVQRLIDTPCIPRKSLKELKVFPVCGELQVYTEQEVQRLEGCIIFRDKVLKGPGSCFKWSPGTDVGLWFSRQFYDPKHGLPPESSSASWDGWPYIEDRALEIHLQEFSQIGWLRLQAE